MCTLNLEFLILQDNYRPIRMPVSAEPLELQGACEHRLLWVFWFVFFLTQETPCFIFSNRDIVGI